MTVMPEILKKLTLLASSPDAIRPARAANDASRSTRVTSRRPVRVVIPDRKEAAGPTLKLTGIMGLLNRLCRQIDAGLLTRTDGVGQ